MIRLGIIDLNIQYYYKLYKLTLLLGFFNNLKDKLRFKPMACHIMIIKCKIYAKLLVVVVNIIYLCNIVRIRGDTAMIISDDILLSCNHIAKTYESSKIQTKVLKDVNIEFKKGSINLIYGKSGSGKTTLLNILAALDKASEGNVYYLGTRYGSKSESELSKMRGQNYGFVFQAYHLIPRINIKENILCPSYINGKKYDKDYFEFLVKEIGIEKLLMKMPYELSGGEQQRVAIVRSMLLKPKIVFADEPTGNLDTNNTKVITELFQKLNREYNTTFIIVTHEEKLIENCDQIIRLRDGEVVIEQ